MEIKSLLLKLRKLFLNKWTFSLFALGILFIITSNIIIIMATKNDIYSSISDTPSEKRVALILGTSKYNMSGGSNLFFKYRIAAAADLYDLGKVSHIIVSGDNAYKEYNEPRQMLQALMKLGIPREVITLDYAGFRTLDSVVRSKKVFGQNKIIIISQRFHLERALFIAEKYDIDAIGYSALSPPDSYSLKTHIREYFAKTKAIIDLYIINKEPKFLGEKVEINLN